MMAKDNPKIAEYIEALKDYDTYTRYHAAEALGKIGDASAIPALIEALKDWNGGIRKNAIEALEKIGTPAVPALIEALKDDNTHTRYYAAEALGKFGGASAIPALIKALKDEVGYIRSSAVEALGKIGDAHTLPRKILAHPKLTTQERIDLLDILRAVRHRDKHNSLRYDFPTIRTLCQEVLNENDAQARDGAHAVLRWLDVEQYLVRASQRDMTTEAEELLREAQKGNTSPPDTLLRASEQTDALPSEPRSLWQRLFGK
jgi:HEAT repeat protein